MKCGEYRKIGVSNNPEKRLKAVQTGNPNVVSLEHYEERDNPHLVEKYLHSRFQSNRVEGEWFKDLTLNEIRIAMITYTEG
tara:strand:+ start:584 stop:826 length:243 start_codon:yes stop_codon:yes gene_type:complete